MKLGKIRKSIYFSILPIIVVLNIGNVFSDEWPMFLHDISHTSFTLDSAPDTPFLLWTFDTKSKIYSSSVIKDGKVYIGNEFGIFSLNAQNGSLIWEMKENALDSTIAVSKNKIIVGSKKKIIALDYRNGELLWEYMVAGKFVEDIPYLWEMFGATIASSPIVYEGKIYIGAGTLVELHPNPEPKYRNEYYVLCLEEATGDEKWHLSTTHDVRSSPALGNNHIFILSEQLYAIDSKNGKIKWTSGKAGFASSSPIIIDNRVITSFVFGNIYSSQSKIIALDIYTGRELWAFDIEYEPYSSFGTGYGKIFINSREGKIYALDEFIGEKIWEYQIAENAEEFFHEINFWSSPAIADNKVFVGSVDGNFYCLDAETGKLLWKYKTGGPIYSSPAISDGKVFIASTDGKLYAFGIDPETYYTKAEKYFSEKQYKKAKEFYMKAKDYYSTKGDTEMINESERKSIITDKKIIEDKSRQEDFAKAENFLEKGNLYLSKGKFRDAVTSFKEAKNIYEKYEEMYKIKLCEDRIGYSEKRIKEQITAGFMILGIILIILVVGILVIRKFKKKETA